LPFHEIENSNNGIIPGDTHKINIESEEWRREKAQKWHVDKTARPKKPKRNGKRKCETFCDVGATAKGDTQ
jgi:hypothetical protein